MTLVLLDTNAYLRLAKRVRPLLGKKFGQREYVLTILRDVENEVKRNPRLQHDFPWFDNVDLTEERGSNTPRLSGADKEKLAIATSVLQGIVQMDIDRFLTNGRSPPSRTDCRVLAFGQIRPAIVVTDDLGMHVLAKMAAIEIWHGHELLKKMLSAKLIGSQLVREIYEALETNGDLQHSWRDAKHHTFIKIFGKAPERL